MSSTTVTSAHVAVPVPSVLLDAGMIEDLYRMTVEEYEQLAEAGFLNERRVELINGLLVKKMTIKPPHVIAVDATREAIGRLLPGGWWIREEKPVRIPDFDEPEPDVSVVRGSRTGLPDPTSRTGRDRIPRRGRGFLAVLGPRREAGGLLPARSSPSTGSLTSLIASSRSTPILTPTDTTTAGSSVLPTRPSSSSAGLRSAE